MATKKAVSSKKKPSTTKKPVAKKAAASKKNDAPVIVEQEIVKIVAPASVETNSEIDDAPFAKMTVSEKLMALKPGALIAEFIGTFVLAAVVLNLAQNKNFGVLGISFALAALVMIFGSISGAHLNPAITIASYVNRKTDGVKTVAYILVQILGAVLAFVVMHALFTANFDNSVLAALTSQGYGESVKQAGGLVEFAKQNNTTVDAIAKTLGVSNFTDVSIAGGQGWTTFFAEVIGSIVFGLGVGFAFFQKNKSKIETGLAVGLGLLGGLVVGGSVVVLNPAVAGALGAFTKGAMFGESAGTFWLALAVYALGTTVGMTIGVTIYRFIFKDAVRK